MNPATIGLIVLGVLLALSTAGNAYFWHERDGLLQREATVTQLQRDTKEAANTCTRSVEDLGKKGAERDRRIAAALDRVAPQVAADQKAALAALAARPDDPKDLCGSLERYLRAQITADRGGKP